MLRAIVVSSRLRNEGHAKVGKTNITAVVDQDVPSMEVAVNNTFSMEVTQSESCLVKLGKSNMLTVFEGHL